MEKIDKNTNFSLKIIIEQFGREWQSIDIYTKRYVVSSKTIYHNLTKLKIDASNYIMEELKIKVKK